ncbi:MAG TPA: hypothetical protein VF334_01435, partial [Polyangia bacterium]
FAGDAASLMQQHLSAVPQAPSALRPGLGADVDRVILKALEKSGGRRHLTLRQLLTEVGATSTTAAAAQPMRAGADAKTVMGMEAPQIVAPRPQAQPQPVARAQPAMPAPASTMLGIPPSSPVGAMGPGSTAPSMPAQPQAPPQAPTMMAEAPAPRPQPAAPRAPMPTPIQQAPLPQAPPPQAQQAAPQAPTMMAEAPRAPANHAPPATAAPAAMPATPLTAKANNQSGKKGAFRETAWFKRGEIEEEMAKAQAAAGDNALKTGTTGQHAPVDDSQVDLSAQDRARLSLKTGATQAMPVIKGVGTGSVPALPGERMNEEEMLAELNPSRKYFIIAGAVLFAIVLAVVIYFATRSAPKAEAPAPEKPAPVAAAPPATAPAPTPPSAVAATPPPATKPPTPPKPPTAPPPAAPAPSPSLYAAQVAKLEASGGSAKEVKRLTKLVAIEQKTARKKKEKELEAADRELLARLKKLHGGR